MEQGTTLTIAANDEDDFAELVARSQALFNAPPVRLQRDMAGRKLTFQAPILQNVACDREGLLVTLEFNTVALRIIGADLGGREALSAGERAAMH